MKIKGRNGLGTVRELAEYLATNISADDIRMKRFNSVDFSILDEIYTDEELEDLEFIASGANGWYGIHEVDCGFDSTDMVLVSDYYGGGSPQLASIWEEDTTDGLAKTIEMLIIGCLEPSNFGVRYDTRLIIEFSTDEEVKQK